MNTFRATNDLLLPLENRLAAYLLSQAEDGWFHGTLTRTAETLSTSYRQLTRVMSRFAQAGYLRRTPEGWRLEEPDALQALAESVEPSRILWKKAPAVPMGTAGHFSFPGVGHMAYLPVENIC